MARSDAWRRFGGEQYQPDPTPEAASLGGMMDASAELSDLLAVLINGRRQLVDGGWSPEVAEQLMVTLVLQAQK